MKNKIPLFCLLLVAISAVFMTVQGSGQLNSPEVEEVERAGLIISEVIADNQSLLTDNTGKRRDMIELYNDSEEAVDLSGYGLTDDPDVSHQFVFPELVMEPFEYLIIYCDDVPDRSEFIVMKKGQSELYTGFRLSKEGEKVLLSDTEGNIVSGLVFEAMEPNMSYAYHQGEYKHLAMGTPGESNEGYFIDDLDEYMDSITIKPTVAPGIYEDAVTLDFETNDRLVLRYTLNSKDPSILSKSYDASITINPTDNQPVRYANIRSTFYELPRVPSSEVSKGLVVKARYFYEDTPVGDMFTGTYFVWDEGSDRYDFDVVSLTSDPENLYNDETGIYVVGKTYLENAPEHTDGGTPANYNNRGRDWEREAHVAFYDSDGSLTFDQDIGIRMFGGWSRANEKKSFKLLARNEYGQSTMDHAFFDDLTDSEGNQIDSFKRLLLRTGGNDFDQALFRDLLVDDLVDGLMDYQEYKQIMVFINGEYFGIYHLREHMDEHYLASHYNVSEDDVAIIAYHPSGLQQYAGSEEEFKRFEAFLEYARNHDLSLDEHFDYVSSQMDMDNFIDYYALNLFIANSDWPSNNSKVWRYHGELDEDTPDDKYRFLLYDTEFSFGMYNGSHHMSFDSFGMLHNISHEIWPNPEWSTNLYRQLMTNEGFKEAFVQRFCDLMNSRFYADDVNARIDDYVTLYKPEMEEYIERFHFWAISNVNDWEFGIVGGIKEFVDGRAGHLFGHAKRHLELGDIKQTKVKKFEGGSIVVNDSFTMTNMESLRKLIYFEGYPVSFEAQAHEGYTFEGWMVSDGFEEHLIQGDLSSALIVFEPGKLLEIEPIFKQK